MNFCLKQLFSFKALLFSGLIKLLPNSKVLLLCSMRNLLIFVVALDVRQSQTIIIKILNAKFQYNSLTPIIKAIRRVNSSYNRHWRLINVLGPNNGLININCNFLKIILITQFRVSNTKYRSSFYNGARSLPREDYFSRFSNVRYNMEHFVLVCSY